MNIAQINTLYLVYILAALLAIFFLLAVYFSFKDLEREGKRSTKAVSH